MFSGARFASVLATLAITACAVEQETGAVAASLDSEGAILGRGEAGALVVGAIEWTAPAGGDGPPRVSLAWRDAEGMLTPIELPSPAIDARVWRGDAVALTQAGEIVREGGDKIASNVIGQLAVSDDGELLVYVIEEDGLGAMHVRSERSDVVVARGLGSAGLMRVTPDGTTVIFVGSDRGGVAGVWAAPIDASGARAITNGELRAGRPWNGAFVPPPAFVPEIDGDLVRWQSQSGERFQRTWRRP